MAKITTHVLDTARGKPAAGVAIVLEKKEGAGFSKVGSGATDDDGRLKTLSDPDGVPAGTYRITFDVGGYYAKLGTESFYPEASVTFVVKDPAQHFHVPLLLAPYGFSTYRGS
jgi:5-hydroxyisourate hydrolase